MDTINNLNLDEHRRIPSHLTYEYLEKMGLFKNDSPINPGSLNDFIKERNTSPNVIPLTIGQPQNFFTYGWKCPNCGSIYSPNTSECYRCNHKFDKVT